MRGVLRIMIAGLFAACATTGATGEQLTRRASFDLDCAPADLRYRKIDSQTQGVVGCGRRATYVETCSRSSQYAESECTWVLNGSVEHAPDATVQPAPRSSLPPRTLPPPTPPAPLDASSPGAAP
ncbi:MAG TPA: hypothetical protein VIX73_09730, partial [Kofleriaceae bacterium]